MEDFDIDLTDVGGTNINNLDSYAHGRNKQPEVINFKKTDIKSKQNVSINNLIRDLESDLKNHDNINNVVEVPEKPKEIIKPTKPIKNDTIEILIYVLVFMILNNRFIIDIIFKYVPFIKTINNPYPNLIIRALIFYAIVSIYKKYYTQ